MKHKLFFLCVAIFMSLPLCYGEVKLTVPDVTVPCGSTSNVVIYVDFGKQAYTAYQMDIAYPEGISSVKDDHVNPAFVKGDIYGETHNVSSIYTDSGKDRFQCFSLSSAPFTTQNGILLTLPIQVQRTLAEGTYQATISPIEFVQTDATPDRPNAITFNIIVTNTVVLDESSTVEPQEATGVDVLVKRTIKAGEWSTICLPFDMTEVQIKSIFGEGVRLGDFTGYEKTGKEGNITGITINFKSAEAIEKNHPYIIMASKDVNEFKLNDVEIIPGNTVVAAVERKKRSWSEMIGTYIANTELEEGMLFINNNKFWYSAGQTKMKAFRAYFDFSDVLADVEASDVKMVIDGIETHITSLTHKANDMNVYDLSGRKIVKSRQRGIYIKGNKKFFIK